MADTSTDPVVSCAWLAEHLDAPDVRVLDGSWFLPSMKLDQHALFAERRIPGALFFDLDVIADTASTLPHMLPSPEKFASSMRKMGVGDGSRIVVYDNHGIFSAARVWWMFRAMGHEDVVVLDGGFPAWEKGGFPIEDGPPRKRTERHFSTLYRDDLVTDLAQMRSFVEKQQATILDARPGDRFRGETPEPRAGLKSGHMPGALSAPLAALTKEGFLKSRDELAAYFDGLGANLHQPIVCTCGSGVTAGVIALALARLGRWNASIYDGAWAEWGALADAPVVTGA